MNSDSYKGYEVFRIDTDNNRIFVTRKPIVPKTPFEMIVFKTDNRLMISKLSDIVVTNPGFRLSKCEIVDITDWEYQSLDDLTLQVLNYQSKSHKSRRYH